MASACTAVMRSRFSVSARLEDSCASCAWRCDYTRVAGAPASARTVHFPSTSRGELRRRRRRRGETHQLPRLDGAARSLRRHRRPRRAAAGVHAPRCHGRLSWLSAPVAPSTATLTGFQLLVQTASRHDGSSRPRRRIQSRERSSHVPISNRDPEKVGAQRGVSRADGRSLCVQPDAVDVERT
jgi:hypothetical protein